MSFPLASRIVLVTGAASGLGKATAERFLQQGAKVVFCDLQIPVEMGSSSNGIFCPVDVTSEEQVLAALQKAQETFGRPIDTVVNCAGIGLARKTISQPRGGDSDHWRVHDQASFDKVLSVNVAGTFNVTRLAVEAMVQAAGNTTDTSLPDRVIVNTASISAYDGQIGQVAYAASKGAIVSMTLPLARELAPQKIRANAIAPGLFKTPLLESLPQKMQDQLGASVPFPSRLGNPDEFAMLVQSIVENPMVNGEVIRIDGALRMPPK